MIGIRGEVEGVAVGVRVGEGVGVGQGAESVGERGVAVVDEMEIQFEEAAAGELVAEAAGEGGGLYGKGLVEPQGLELSSGVSHSGPEPEAVVGFADGLGPEGGHA